ncbi:MAG: synthase (F/14-kDa) subunit [Methanofollis sp.]|nr:synthase (F/14-kDa) subunit [Methanofollis sp.]
MNVTAIGDRTMALACRAGGIVGAVVCVDVQDAEQALKKALSEKENGVILVLDRYLAAIPPPQIPGVYPIVIGVPGPSGPAHGEDTVGRAVRRVAGRGLPGVRE